MATSSSSRQAGFGVVVIVVVTLVAALAAAVGVVVYKRSNDKTNGSTSTNTPSPVPQSPTTMPPVTEPQTPASDKFELPELGVRFTIPDSLKDLTYVVKDVELSNGRTAKAAYFSTQALTSADAKCAADAVSIAAMARGDGQYPTDGTRVDYGPLLKQFPTAFVTFNTSRTSCTTSTDAELHKRISDTTQALSEGVKTVELIQ